MLHIRDDEQPRVWSYLTLARVALEAFIRSAYFAERSPSPAEQSLRHVAGLISGLREQVAFAHDLKEEEELKQSQRALQAVEVRARRTGVAIHPDRRGRASRLELDGLSMNVEVDVTGQVRKRLSEVPVAYRVGSAVAHSGMWSLGGALRPGSNGELDMMPDPDLMIAAVVGACEAAVHSAAALSPSTAQARVDALRSTLQRDQRRALVLRYR